MRLYEIQIVYRPSLHRGFFTLSLFPSYWETRGTAELSGVCLFIAYRQAGFLVAFILGYFDFWFSYNSYGIILSQRKTTENFVEAFEEDCLRVRYADEGARKG